MTFYEFINSKNTKNLFNLGVFACPVAPEDGTGVSWWPPVLIPL
jgi:hypothetical protein